MKVLRVNSMIDEALYHRTQQACDKIASRGGQLYPPISSQLYDSLDTCLLLAHAAKQPTLAYIFY